jgi:hypothetical protein
VNDSKDSKTVLEPSFEGQGETVDFAWVIQKLWMRRNLIIKAVSLGTLIALAAAYWRSTYVSEGLFQLIAPAVRTGETQNQLVVGSLAFSDFKRVLSAAGEGSRMDSFLASKGLSNNEEAKNLATLVASKDALTRTLDPQFNVSRADAKELVDIGSKENATQIMGVRIASQASTPDLAQKRAQLIAQYLLDTSFQIGLVQYARTREAEFSQNLLLADDLLISRTFDLKLIAEKIVELKAIAIRNPEAGRLSAGQVVGLNESTTRFLPIATQLVALETQATDIKQSIERTNRVRAQTDIMRAYYDQLRAVADKGATGEQLVSRMTPTITSVLVNKSRSDDVYAQVELQLSLEAEKVSRGYHSNSRYISGPNLPRERNWNPVLVIIFSAVGLGFLLCALVLIHAWFIANRTKIVTP